MSADASKAAPTAKLRTCLWFASDGEAAARFYVSLLPDSQFDEIVRPAPDAPAVFVAFTLVGAPFSALNGGPLDTPTPAASIAVTTEDQPETDRLWEALTSNGGAAGRCGWLTDRWGVSWQITPRALTRLLGSADASVAARAQAAMMAMEKIDIAALEAAALGRG